MFLCPKCHDCDYPLCKLFGPQSHGRCEGCGHTDICVDCHAPLSPRKEAAIEALERGDTDRFGALMAEDD